MKIIITTYNSNKKENTTQQLIFQFIITYEKTQNSSCITGASGAIYAKVLLDKLTTLKSQIESIGLVMSDNAKYVWKQELENEDYKIII